MFFGLPGTDKTRVYQFLAGPHVAIRNATRMTRFARALFGAARRLLRDTTGVPFDLKGVRRDNVRLTFGVILR